MRWIAAILAFSMAAIAAVAQTPAGQKPSFEVASVKPVQFPAGFHPSSLPTPSPIRISGNAVSLRGNVTSLVLAAYSIKTFQLSVAPDWANNTFFEINGKAEENSTPSIDQARQMLQTLLAERFQLKVHRETKEMAVYELVIGKNGPKLKAVPPGAEAIAPRPPLLQSSIEQLVSLISLTLDRPLIDQTGLVGMFEYTMDFGQLDRDRVANRDNPTAAIFTPVEDQLGLKLEAAQETVEMLVIDNVQRPTEN